MPRDPASRIVELRGIVADEVLNGSYLAAGGEKSRETAVPGNAKLAAQTGTTVSALLGGAVVTLSYGHLLWANAMLSWIPVLLVLRATEPPAALDRGRNGRKSSRRPAWPGRSWPSAGDLTA
jgi:hypothetical protein